MWASAKRLKVMNRAIPPTIAGCNEIHYSNEREPCKLIEKIIVPHINKVRQQERLPVDQKSLVILDGFTDQMTTTVLDLYKEDNIEVVCLLANMTHILQPLDLTVNGYTKGFTRVKFNDWYSSQITDQLDMVTPLHDNECTVIIIETFSCAVDGGIV